MLAVHWSPVKNTKNILHNGIRKSQRGLFCFPLTGHPNLDKWWANAFRQWRPRTAYNGFVFRIVEDDLPAAFSNWVHGSERKPFTSIAEIKAEFERVIMFRIGERHIHDQWQAGHIFEPGTAHDYEQIGREIVARKPETYLQVLDGDAEFMEYIFQDYQIVLSRSITAKRIMHVMSGANDYGRNIARQKKQRSFLLSKKDAF